MALLSVIRRWRHRDKISIRQIVRRTGLSRNTVRKYPASGVVEPKYSRSKAPSELDDYAHTLTSRLHREARRKRMQRLSVKVRDSTTLDWIRFSSRYQHLGK